MREARTILVAVLCSVSQPARAETWVVSDRDTEALCRAVEAELEQINIDGIETRTHAGTRRARRKAFADRGVNALAICRGDPPRIEVFYPDGTRFGAPAFIVPAEDQAATAAVYVSERIRSERFIADVAVPVPFAPAIWWLGVGADALFSPGGITPLAFITVDVGYRFHRHWSLDAFASVQPYMSRLDADGLRTKLRLDQFGLAIAYHPLVTDRVDLALGARAAVARFGVEGTGAEPGVTLEGQNDSAWLALVAARLSFRVALGGAFWLHFRGELGALLPRAVVPGDETELGSLGVLAGQAGLGLEVHFR